MAQYFFVVRANNAATHERTVELKDDAAALAHAFEILRELALKANDTDRDSLVTVRDEVRPMVFAIPLLPACA
jgi:hypothetical protein